MINNKKVIGVCVTKINDNTRCEYLNRLHHSACKSGYKLIVFNSFEDFYNNDRFDTGAGSVYDLVDYNIIDVLVVVYDTFLNKTVPENIISSAKKNSVPVIVVNGRSDDCISIEADYRLSFKSIMNHVIRDHGVTDTFFIAGRREADEGSVIRISCYKEALEENGLAFDESRVAYGEYWNDPTERIVRKLLDNGKKPPRAIFCANDYMAFAVCNKLCNEGYRVPEDVIVTGFDGIPEAEYFRPRLTTCHENIEEIAELTVKAADTALSGNTTAEFTYNYTPDISESCGCKSLESSDFRNAAAELYRHIHDSEIHEEFEYGWIDKMLDIQDMNSLYATISGCILERSYACLNSDFAAAIMDPTHKKSESLFSDKLIVIGSGYSDDEAEKNGTLALSELIPNAESWAESNEACILSSIYIGDLVVGYYVVKTDNMQYSKRKIRRVLKTINISFNIAMNYFRQKTLSQKAERFALINPITNLPNLKGAVKWFEEFSSSEENRNTTISVSVYGIPKYSYIIENYGNKDIEEALRFVSEALKIANPVDCYIAHIADDEFVVVNYYKDPDSINDVINKSTSVFFESINGYNASSNREYFVEVNCGCTVGSGGWTNSLESFIKFANSEMYINRLKYGIGAFRKEELSTKDYYNAFIRLIDKNLFSYHFQPIVSARTGDIIAYEALMRTDSSIGMNPLQVLDTAREYGKLYEVEKATMFNVMERYSTEEESFNGRIVFINTIPGFFLNDYDRSVLCKKYGNIMDKFVFELTEQDTVSDDELDIIRSMSGQEDVNQIAVDDYGTGHSNIVNLMRYAPQIIKIDRFLITDIHKDRNKQMFVKSTIDFARLNGIKVLAEGVETSNELRTVIDLGVDLIQGYYTARPVPQPIAEIPDDIRQEIIEANPLLMQD